MKEINSYNFKVDGVDTKVTILWDEELIFVAESDGNKLGEFSLKYNADGVLYIEHMEVNDGYRKKGIGTLILNEIIKIYDDSVAKYYLYVKQNKDSDHLSNEGAAFLNSYFDNI